MRTPVHQKRKTGTRRASRTARIGAAAVTAGALLSPLFLGGTAPPALAAPAIQQTVQVVAGATSGQFNDPTGVAVDPVSGDTFVVDSANNRIRRLSGAVLTTVASGVNGPVDIAFNATGDLFVVDHHLSSNGGTGASRIQKATAASIAARTTSTPFAAFAGAATPATSLDPQNLAAPAAHQFSTAVTSIAAGPGGDVFVVDKGQAVVVSIDAGAMAVTHKAGLKGGFQQVDTSLRSATGVNLGDADAIAFGAAGVAFVSNDAGKVMRLQNGLMSVLTTFTDPVTDIAATATDVYAATDDGSIPPAVLVHRVNPTSGSSMVLAGGTAGTAPSTVPRLPTTVELDPVSGMAAASGRLVLSSFPSGPGRDVVMTVEDTQAPEVTSSASTAAQPGAGVSHTFTSVGKPQPTWAVTSGSLPTGLQLDADSGVLSGSVSAVGAYTFTVTATNSTASDPQPFTVSITAPPSGGGGGAAPPALLPQTVQLPRTLSAPLGAGTARLAAKASAGGALTFTSSDPSVATVDGGGVLILRAVGTTTVTASAAATATHAAATASATVVVTAPSSPSLPSGATRLAGADRVDTSVQVSRKVFADPREGAATAAVIATAGSFADSVAGARLAGQAQAPLLLTDRGALDDDVAAEVRRLVRPGGTVYVLGRSGALSNGVESALQGLGSEYAVQRLGGADRYETAVAVADAVTALAGDVGPIHLVTGRDFADGVSVAAFAQRTGGVVLLTDGPRLPPATAAYLRQHDPKGDRAVAVGGAAAAAARMAGFGGAASRAVVGADRYATSAELAQRFAGLTTAASPKGNVTTTGLAGGASWPDALAGSAAMAHLDGPLLLTPTGTGQLDPTTAAALRTLAPSAARAVVFGGPKAVSEAALGQVAGTLTR